MTSDGKSLPRRLRAPQRRCAVAVGWAKSPAMPPRFGTGRERFCPRVLFRLADARGHGARNEACEDLHKLVYARAFAHPTELRQLARPAPGPFTAASPRALPARAA